MIGFVLDEVFIPTEIADRIIGYELCYAQRDTANSLVLGQSISVFGSTQNELGDGDDNVYFGVDPEDGVQSTSGNWHFYDNEDDEPDFARWLRGDWIRMHPPDMLRVKPGILPTYAQHELKLGKSAKILTNPPPGGSASDNHSVLVDLNFLNSDELTGVYLPEVENVLHRLTDFQYLAGNTNPVGDVNNAGCEECVLARFVTGSTSGYQGLYGSSPLPYLVDISADNKWTEPDGDSGTLSGGGTGLFFSEHPQTADIGDVQYGGMWTEHYLTSLLAYRKDVYVAFGEQTLVPTGVVVRVTAAGSQPASPAIFGGDTFLTDYGVRLTSPTRQTPNNPQDGVKTLMYYAVESTMNVGFRQDGNGYSYYPRIAATGNYITEWLDLPAYISLPLVYNTDYTAKNDLQPAFVYTEGRFQTAFPNRILQFRSTRREGRTLGFRLAANDYYDLTAERGEIMNLFELGSRLLIHCRRGPYLTVPQAQFQTDSIKVTLGTGGIFEVAPQPIGSGRGEMGLTSLYSAIGTPLGYFFFSSQASAWLIDLQGRPREITSGLFNWFQPEVRRTEDNPYLGSGLFAAWDAEEKRILLLKKDAESGTDWLWSWSPLLQGSDGQPGAWVSQHDWLPAIVASSGVTLYSWQSDRFHLHNVGLPASFYGTRYPVSIDVAFPSPKIVKWFALNWVADVLQDGNVLWDRTFTRMLVYTLVRCSDYVDLIRREVDEGTMRYVEGYWWTNAFRDQIIDPLLPATVGEEPRKEPNLANLRQRFRPGDFTSDHVVVRLEFLPNKPGEEGLSLTLHSLSAEARLSIR